MQGQGFVAHREQVEAMLNWSASRPETRRYTSLFLLTYAFMLRLPSEALPLALGSADGQAVLSREGEQLVLRLRRRLLVCVLAVGASLPRFSSQGKTAHMEAD